MRAVAFLPVLLLPGCGDEAKFNADCQKVLSKGCDREINCGRAMDHFLCLESEETQWICREGTTEEQFEQCILAMENETCDIGKPYDCLEILCSTVSGCFDTPSTNIETQITQ